VGAVSALQAFDNTINSATPNYYVGYRYYVSNRVAIGISVATQTLWGNSVDDYTGQPFTFKENTVTFAADLKWMLISHNNFQMYQDISAGVTYYTEDDQYQGLPASSFNGFKFNGQATLLGIRVGRSLGVFGELGIGYRGLVSCGLSYEPGFRR